MKYIFTCLSAAIIITFSACDKENPILDYQRPDLPKILTSIYRDGQKDIEFYYDDLERLTEVWKYYEDTITFKESYEYNGAGKLISKTYYGQTLSYVYNDKGLLISTTSRMTEHEWEMTYKYQYSGSRMISARVFNTEGKEFSRIEYKYDGRGNTIERNEYSINEGKKSDFMMSQYTFRYDDKPNPLSFPALYHIDIIQHNNPVYSYYTSPILCSIPPEYTIRYEYDEYGLPLRATSSTEWHVTEYEYFYRESL